MSDLNWKPLGKKFHPTPEKANKIGSFKGLVEGFHHGKVHNRILHYYMFTLNWTRKMMSTCGITNAPSLDNGITNHHLTCQYLNGLSFYILSDDSKGTTGEQLGTATRDCMTESYKGQMTDPPIQVVKIRSSDYQKVELSDSKDHTYALYTKKQRVSRTLRCSHYKGTPPSVCFKSGRC